MVVQAVPANEGFWAGCGADRLWVQLEGRSESPFSVRAGQRLTLRGLIQVNPPGFRAAVGLSPEEGAGELDRQGYHLRARYDEVRPI